MGTKSIGVLGAGISGLTCAHELAAIGKVTVIHHSDLLATTSAIATAIWHVYLIDPSEQQHLQWSSQTLAKLMVLSNEPEAGIELCDGVELFRTSTPYDPTWRDIAVGFQPLSAEELTNYPGRAWGYRISAPVANMHKYLPWLHSRCEDRGVSFQRRHVDSLDDVLDEYDVVINCTGLEARQLTDDPELYPVRGQYLVFDPLDTIPSFYIGDDEHPGGMAYMIPRDGQVLIGGTEEPGEWDLAFSADIDEMTSRGTTFCEELTPLLSFKNVVVGLRPCRTSRRVRFGFDPERPTLIHNYGHGGSGFSLAWGCAADVTALAETV